MDSQGGARSPARAVPRIRLEGLRGALLWLTGFAGAFVFMEPSPYEFASLLTIVFFAAAGLALRPALMPLVFLLTLYNIGFSIAVIPVLDQSIARTWVLVSWYLSATALFFAAMLGSNTQQRLGLLMRGYMLAAIVAASAGVIGYFHLVPAFSELFVRFNRARGTFNDPNVLGAFLVLPMMFMLQRMLTGNLRSSLRAAVPLALFACGVLLSFSRGAWGQAMLAAIVLMMLHFVISRSPVERLRIIVIAVIGLLCLAAFVAALLSIDQVAQLFRERASLEQSYDTGHFGRFGRHVLGFLMALDQPLGIGPLQFRSYFPEDPHNAYLNTFMSGGWLTGFSYLALTLITVVMGLRFAFVATPWRTAYLAIYATYVATAVESAIIDSDHWRHYFLLLGVVWGLMTAARAYMRRPQPLRSARPAFAA